MKNDGGPLEYKLDAALSLLRHLLAIELAREGVSHQAIAKHLRVAKATVGKLVKGVRRHGQEQ